MELSQSISIAAPIERVWSVMIDVERWPEWSASIDRVQKLSEGDLAVGSGVAIKQPRLPRAVWQVTRSSPAGASPGKAGHPASGPWPGTAWPST